MKTKPIVKLALIHYKKKIKEQPKGSNKGDSVSKWSRNIFGKDRIPWCATYGSELIKTTKSRPVIKSAQAKRFIVKGHSISAKDVVRGIKSLETPSWAVKGRKGGNHVDLLIDYNPKTREMTLIGGNVSDAVSYRKQKLNLTDRFGYTHFTKVQ